MHKHYTAYFKSNTQEQDLSKLRLCANMALLARFSRPVQRLNLTPPWLRRICMHQVPGLRPKSALVRYNNMTAATRQGDNLDPTELIAEETLPGYDPADYYPVRLGEVLGGKYRVISKLGFGSRSTVWLCRDESQYLSINYLFRQHNTYPLYSPSPEYVAVKAYINQIQSNSELEAYLHLDTLPSQHQGQAYVRKAYDYFELESPHRKHLCLVQEPLGVSLGDVLNRIQRGPLEAPAVRYIIRRVLKALDYLHTEANIVHTGREWDKLGSE